MSESTYPNVTRRLVEARRALAPELEDAFRAFSQKVFADGALPAKTKELIAVAVAHVTQCPYCIKGHTKAARQHGATFRDGAAQRLIDVSHDQGGNRQGLRGDGVHVVGEKAHQHQAEQSRSEELHRHQAPR